MVAIEIILDCTVLKFQAIKKRAVRRINNTFVYYLLAGDLESVPK